ncbi:phospho-N-acetylmuramoyl-pentapeptide-transferase [Clostridium botulinum]|uniref:Phospho-N-acetylmuramoyl-pentapeptide-transferase n=1 Tax=Clostridium botulinum TaxID=1491 RepID=A0A9Q1ZC58_CLOBO|nr:phospho-N-acetylmuramoyl-pentapeptide-transferase [Clostridium botulinum]AEB75845.1 phospho-N-acetylmuramoyl-pentapeptide- transferase [Clostridium botulinum BKT015925]KEI04729.1 phospho-N-acetylmuramoyl-pentapeptide-transferase [Clostridium botulinum C/D str. Sp77]KLU75676.1 phospho-N-acetylmuramoyl-pentapeptide-transferase [Clostridium botulinum V891]KOA75251.1 phospho-N-acetylmuramoyl-pentapeptide-transferase [Clostridium botulinum]KOA79031.1 phospho-N-acetylmuramoyl-pentapeptide-transfe
MSLMIYSVLVAFIISLLQGPILIPLLHKFKFGQNIRSEGPQSHKKKSGTPTMGGIIFIISSIVTVFIITRHPSFETKLAMFAFVGFGIIGLIDDSLKIIHKENEGLKAYQKMILLLIVSSIIAFYAYNNPKIGSEIIIPFVHKTCNLGIFYIPFIVVYFAATTNAVNLTDGLDGLATSITLLVMTFFAVVSYATGNYTLAVFCATVGGALLGFLKYNAYPAQIFMGDTGSLALGGVVGAVAMMLKLPLIVPIVGGIYLAETLSVIIQVTSFKLTGKRVFKMSPIHHHFELSGWHETKVVSIFSIITVILCLIGFLSLIKMNSLSL